MTRRLGIACAVAILAGVATAAPATAQGPARTVFRVRVRDEAGRPVPDAEITVARGLQTVAAGGTTDSAGARTFSAALRRGGYELVVRRIGYVRAARFLEAAGNDTLTVDVGVVETPRVLEAVTVSARESVRRQRMHIDADAIASSRQYLRDAMDIVVRLRPLMVNGLSGMCPPVSNVWVNGKRIVNVLPDPMIQTERGTVFSGRYDLPHAGPTSVVAGTAAAGDSAPPIEPVGRNAIPIGVATVLASIHPEHVAEVTAHDCNDLSVAKARASNAVFVVLKAGVEYSTKRGSFVSDRTLFDRLGVAEVTAAPAPAPPRVDALPAYRRRILGVFDETTGGTLPGVEVVERRGGWKATTTVTGTVSLLFLPEGINTVRLSRPGYRTLEIPVTISPTDTVPITALLSRVP